MKKTLILMACLGICACFLTACAKEKSFSAGEEMTAEELKLYRERLLQAQEESKTSEESAIPESDAEADGEETLGLCYYTENGSVWHANRDCSYLKRSQNILEGSVEGAAIAGKTRPCSSCAAAYIED